MNTYFGLIWHHLTMQMKWQNGLSNTKSNLYQNKSIHQIFQKLEQLKTFGRLLQGMYMRAVGKQKQNYS